MPLQAYLFWRAISKYRPLCIPASALNEQAGDVCAHRGTLRKRPAQHVKLEPQTVHGNGVLPGEILHHACEEGLCEEKAWATRGGEAGGRKTMQSRGEYMHARRGCIGGAFAQMPCATHTHLISRRQRAACPYQSSRRRTGAAV